MMRRALAAAILAVAFATLAAAHETTEIATYAEAMTRSTTEISDTFLAAAGIGEPEREARFIALTADSTAARMKEALLGIVPETCYLESYGLAWVMYGDLLAIAEAPDDARRIAAVATFRERWEDAANAYPVACP